MAQKRSIREVAGTEEIDATATARAAPRPKTKDGDELLNSTQKHISSLVLTLPSKDSSFQPVEFQRPFQLLSFSYDAKRDLYFDDRGLRFYVEPPRNADLTHGYEEWIKRPEEKGRLDGLLKAALQDACTDTRKRAGAVMWRGVLTKILVAPYEERDGWRLNVMMIDGTLYLEEHLTNGQLISKEDMAPRQRLQTYQGYAFESWCTSTQPQKGGERGEWGGKVNTNEQWCSVVKGKLGNTRLFLGGEVDCVRDRFTGQPDTFVELKTSMSIRNAWDEGKFEKKLLKYYFQSFLLGVPEIVVGFKTPKGTIQTVQSFKTLEIPRMVRGKPDAWNPALCLSWGAKTLDQIKTWMEEHGLELKGAKETLNEVKMGRVTYDPKDGVSFEVLDKEEIEDVRGLEDRFGFLPTWYVEACWPDKETSPS